MDIRKIEQHVPALPRPDQVLPSFFEHVPQIVFGSFQFDRCRIVADFLEQSGIPEMHSLAGGIEAWSWEVDPKLPRY